MAGHKAGGHFEQTGQLSSLRSVIMTKVRQRKTPDQQEKIGGVEWNSIYINEPTISCRC